MRYSAFICPLLCLLLLSCGSRTERLDGYEVHGIDVSHHQAEINWEEVANQAISFAFVKASEGETFSDKLFQKNWEAAKSVGLKRGAYHFFRPKVSGLKQALNFIDQVELSLGDLPPVLDVEVEDSVSDLVTISRIRSWLQIIEKHYQVRPIIYTNLKFHKRYIAGNFDDYPIWMARYHHYAPSTSNSQPWSFWQYGNRGRINGIKGDVDLNVFNGSLEELDAMGLGASPAMSVGY